VNLAAPLVDGEQVVVAERSAGGTGVAGSSGPVSLSSATAEQLDTLPGIGPVTAQKIVDYRQQHGPFTSLDGLDAIPGIGAARIQELQGLAVP
jgi:competence protein ComEA